MPAHILQPFDTDKVDYAQLVALGSRIFADQLVQLIHLNAGSRGWKPVEISKKIDAENTRRNDNTCASHDYCDANVALIFTMRILTGLKDFGDHGGTEHSFDLENAIWDQTKKAGFWKLYQAVVND